jgi:hypothetical protein
VGTGLVESRASNSDPMGVCNVPVRLYEELDPDCQIAIRWPVIVDAPSTVSLCKRDPEIFTNQPAVLEQLENI